MAGYVLNRETGRKVKGVASVMKRWSTLRLQPGDLIKRRVRVQILNAIWMAHNRKQKSGITIAWIAAESHAPGMAASSQLDMVKRFISGDILLVKSLGFEAKYLEESEKYGFFRSPTSPSSDDVTLIGIELVLYPDSNVREVRSRLFEETKLIPKEHRKQAWTKKRRRKKAGGS